MKNIIKRTGIIIAGLIVVIAIASVIAAVLSVAAAGFISGHWFIGTEMSLMAIALAAYAYSKKEYLKEKIMTFLEGVIEAM